MKTLDDVKANMSKLYKGVESGSLDLKTADSLANIAGKFLKAEQLQLAREIFIDSRFRRLPGDDIDLEIDPRLVRTIASGPTAKPEQSVAQLKHDGRRKDKEQPARRAAGR